MFRVTMVLPTLLMTVPLQGLTAQTGATLIRLEGEKVRLRVASSAALRSMGIQGTVFSLRGDSIQVVENGGRLWSLPLSSLQSIAVSHGRDRWRGAGIGALGGVAFGLLLSSGSPDCDGRGNGYDCRSDGTIPTTAQYTWENVEAGMVLGALIGAAIGVERWERIMAQPRVSVAPVPGGVGLRLSY